MKNCVHEGGPGTKVPWTNGTGAAVVAGQVVVMGHLLGVAAVAIADGAVGTVYVDGVFTVAKATGHAWTQGDAVIWDVSASAFDYSGATPATGDVSKAAVAWVAAASADTTATIKLVQNAGSTVT